MRHIFLLTHLGSGASMLMDMLAGSRRVATIRQKSMYYQYDDPAKLESIVRPALEVRPLARTFVHKLNYNHTLACPAFLWAVDVMLMVRGPEGTLDHLVGRRRYSEMAALRYYTYRLRRLCEIARRVPAAVVVTWDGLLSRRAFDGIKQFVGVRELTSTYRDEPPERVVSDWAVDKARRAYDRYLAYLRRLGLTVLE